MATQKQIAAHLDLSQAAVSQLAAAGIIEAAGGRGSFDVDDCRVAYIRHLREMAAGRSAGDGDAPNLVQERARLARAQAINQERKNAEADGRIVDMATVDRVFFEIAQGARDAWRNWPSRTAPVIAADLGVSIDKLLGALEEHVHRQLVDLGEPELPHDLAGGRG